MSTAEDIVQNVHSGHLTARGYWADVEHPELDTTITYPGASVNASEVPPEVRRRASHIGEHNREIYKRELGVSREQLVVLKQAGVIYQFEAIHPFLERSGVVSSVLFQVLLLLLALF